MRSARRRVTITMTLAAVALGACGFSSRLAADGGPAGASGDGSAGPAAADAGGALDAAPTADASPPLVALSQTRGEVVAPGTSVVCYAPGAQSTRDGVWYRLFRLADSGIRGALQVTAVSFATNGSRGARGVTVRVGTYAGVLGGATIAASAISIVAEATVDVPDGDQPGRVSVPISARVSGVLIVAVAAPSLQGAGSFHLGATTAGETAPGYFSSTACAISPPESTVSLGGAGQILIGAIGYPAP